jgi:DNA-binding FadR family transcriptional regulator
MAGRFIEDGVVWTEPQLCATFQISRTSLREAMKILSAKGIVETRRKRGTILRQRSDWNLLDPDVIRWLLIAEPERTAAALADAVRVLARAASQSVTATSDQPLPALQSDAEQMRRASNPFLSAFAKTTLSALRAPLSHKAALPHTRP